MNMVTWERCFHSFNNEDCWHVTESEMDLIIKSLNDADRLKAEQETTIPVADWVEKCKEVTELKNKLAKVAEKARELVSVYGHDKTPHIEQVNGSISDWVREYGNGKLARAIGKEIDEILGGDK